uniref:polysaccharide pyruvyl transferase family protein n=1 Tax=Phocaeicola coprophilus TaxID=387090 RepID=UPI002795BD78|nr:polysaccharide pyruvyl transferase family protein [Phocaeicola coprophilus]
MKIAILTLPLHTNYGGIIQNYALQTVLEKMGHEVYTINLNKPKAKINLAKAPLIISKRLIKKILGRKDGIIFLERKRNKDELVIKKYINRFINNKIHLTEPFYLKRDLQKINHMGFNSIIVGSDQVWRIPYTYPDIQTYFLDFIKNKNIQKIAYSASFGTDDIEFSEEQIKECGKLIKDFKRVSVREDSALDLINNKYKWECKYKPIQTLDPTMLLTKEEYINLSSDYKNKLDGELFYYILDMTEDKKKVLDQMSKDLGYKPFTVKSISDNWFDDVQKQIVPPIELWLQAFNKAKYIFTDSFHGCVFSIIFNKDFVAYGNKERGLSRFDSLIRMFNIKDRFIYKYEDYSFSLIQNLINWNNINTIHKKNKLESLELLDID